MNGRGGGRGGAEGFVVVVVVAWVVSRPAPDFAARVPRETRREASYATWRRLRSAGQGRKALTRPQGCAAGATARVVACTSCLLTKSSSQSSKRGGERRAGVFNVSKRSREVVSWERLIATRRNALTLCSLQLMSRALGNAELSRLENKNRVSVSLAISPARTSCTST